MAKSEQKTETETQPDTQVETSENTALTETGKDGEVTETGGAVSETGTRARRVIQMKQMLPNPDWINKNVVAGGKGTQAVVGRVYGTATGFENKVNEVQGQLLPSIAVKGIFQMESYVTGEVGEASTVYFPMAYAEKIRAVFEASKRNAGTDEKPNYVYDVSVIEVDCDIGLEATGKTIPYEWVVIAFMEGKEMDVLKRIKNGRKRPEHAGKAMLPAGDNATAGLLTQG